MAKPKNTGFVGPGFVAEGVALAEQLNLVRPVKGPKWDWGNALGDYLPGLSNRTVLLVCGASLAYAILKLKLFG